MNRQLVIIVLAVVLVAALIGGAIALYNNRKVVFGASTDDVPTDLVDRMKEWETKKQSYLTRYGVEMNKYGQIFRDARRPVYDSGMPLFLSKHFPDYLYKPGYGQINLQTDAGTDVYPRYTRYNALVSATKENQASWGYRNDQLLGLFYEEGNIKAIFRDNYGSQSTIFTANVPPEYRPNGADDGKEKHLVMQPDGNLVLYVTAPGKPIRAIWSSDTWKWGVENGPYYAYMYNGKLYIWSLKLNKIIWSSPSGDCGSCYGAGKEGQCCNTCDEVVSAYRSKNWAYNKQNFSQCQ